MFNPKCFNYRTAAQSHGSAFYGQGYGTILLDDVICTGNENDINECTHNPWGDHNCRHSEDVGVNCAGIILLLFTV